MQEREGINIGNLYAGLEHLQSHAVRHSVPSVHHVQVTHCLYVCDFLFYFFWL